MENEEDDCDKIGIPEEIDHKRNWWRKAPTSIKFNSPPEVTIDDNFITIQSDILRKYVKQKEKEAQKSKVEDKYEYPYD